MKYKKQVTLTKEELRAQSEAAMKEAMERKLTVKQLDSRKEVKCGKCGASTALPPRRDNIAANSKCGEEQRSL
jgi:hypothetical protein